MTNIAKMELVRVIPVLFVRNAGSWLKVIKFESGKRKDHTLVFINPENLLLG